ncbi:MAG: Spy/CpxP family protein refolding chaperone [Gammaproteobacteria bacterium]|nr:Spy/CpxP family protein refolding chaperone [Gammaproteobacteria bacterium]
MRLIPSLAIAALSLGLSAAALAHDKETKGMPFGHDREAMHAYMQSPEGQAQMQQRLDNHLDKVREALKLSEAQDKDWQAFTTSLKADLAQLRQLHSQARPADGEQPALTTRLQQRLDGMRAALPVLEHALDGLKGFYAGLSPEQQAVLDRQLRLRALVGHGFGHGGHEAHDKQR